MPVWLVVAAIGAVLAWLGFAGIGSLLIWIGVIIVVGALVMTVVSRRRHR
ncbi:hypothetical protein [Cellulomonas sp. ICMP 17802]